MSIGIKLLFYSFVVAFVRILFDKIKIYSENRNKPRMFLFLKEQH